MEKTPKYFPHIADGDHGAICNSFDLDGTPNNSETYPGLFV